MVINNEEDAENIEEGEALTVPIIKPNNQKHTKKKLAVNRINLRKPESNKKKANVQKYILLGQHRNKCNHIEEYRRFDYISLMEELDN